MNDNSRIVFRDGKPADRFYDRLRNETFRLWFCCVRCEEKLAGTHTGKQQHVIASITQVGRAQTHIAIPPVK